MAARAGESADLSPFAHASASASRWRDTESRMCRKYVARVPSYNRLGIAPSRDNPEFSHAGIMRRALSMATFFSRAFNALPGRHSLRFSASERAACFVTQQLATGIASVSAMVYLALSPCERLLAVLRYLLFNIERAPERASVVNAAMDTFEGEVRILEKYIYTRRHV